MKQFVRLAILTLFLFPLHTRAQGTAFTYQGRLNSDGNSANGNYDVAFTLFAANAGGVAIAIPATNTAVAVSNGLFTTTIDFGPGMFLGTSNWLEIAVRTNGNGSFTTLSPRQQVMPAPYAIFANTASNLSGTLPAAQLSGTLPASQLSGVLSAAQLSGTYSGTLTLNNTGNSFAGNGGGLTNISLSGVGAAGTFAVLPIYFAPAVTMTLPYGPSSVLTADVNNDGKPDLLVVFPTFTNNVPYYGAILVYTNDGHGSLVCASTNLDFNGSIGTVVTADFNGDGKLDLAASDSSVGVVVFKGFGNGTFTPVLTNNLGALIPVNDSGRVLAVADVNGDTYPDLIVGDNSSPAVLRVLANFGGGVFAFTQIQSISLNDAFYSITTRDVNNDSKPDIIFAGGYGAVVYTNSSGLFTVASTNAAGGVPVADGVLTGDVNGDGRPDLIVSSYILNSIVVYTNSGGGNFISNSTTFTGNIPISLVAITNNIGAITEVAALNGQDGTVSVLANDGHGNFTRIGSAFASNNTFLDAYMMALTALDLNGNGNLVFFTAAFEGNNVIELPTYQQTLAIQNPLVMTNLQNSVAGYFTGNGAALSNLNATQLTAGTLADARLSANVAFLSSTQTFTGANTFSSANNSFYGNVYNGFSFIGTHFSGSGSGLTALNASQLTSGTVPQAQLPAVVVTNTENSVTLSGTFSGNGSGLNTLNASQLTSGVVPQSVLPGFQSASNYSTVAGGQANDIAPSSDHSAIGGGWQNTIGTNDYEGAIAGGYQNTISNSSPYVFIGGGNAIRVGTNSGYSAIVGGQNNLVLNNAPYATLGGGVANTVGGFAATVPGGRNNGATGSYSYAAGFDAQATNGGSFVWADASGFIVPISSTNDNSVTFRAAGGYQLFSSSTGRGGSGVYLAPGGNSWTALSDRNAKKDFSPVDYQAVLNTLAQVPIEQWHYKWESATDTLNLGPMAQDFKAAFYPGRDDKGISTLEFDGVELAAIQGLNQKLNEKDAEIKDLKARLEKLEQLMDSKAAQAK